MSNVDTAFEMVVGLEVHVQLKTATKAFCRCSSDFGGLPNSEPAAFARVNRRQHVCQEGGDLLLLDQLLAEL